MYTRMIMLDLNLVVFDEVKGGFPPTSGIKKYHIKRKQEGDPVIGRGQNIPLVTDTGSGLCRQA